MFAVGQCDQNGGHGVLAFGLDQTIDGQFKVPAQDTPLIENAILDRLNEFFAE